MKKEKSIKMGATEWEYFKQIHYTRVGLMGMIGENNRAKERAMRCLEEKHKLKKYSFSVNVETGEITLK